MRATPCTTRVAATVAKKGASRGDSHICAARAKSGREEMARRDEIAPGVHRLTICPAGSPIAFNHFLLAGERPALVHLGMRSIFPRLKSLVEEVVDPKSLQGLFASHFEADECGALNLWQEVAPEAAFHASKICCSSARDFALRPPQPVADGDVLSFGGERLRILETPHFPHGWDACLFFGETTRTLFASDVGTLGGFHPPFVEGSSTARILALAKKLDYLGTGRHASGALARLAALNFEVVATMHGPALRQKQARELFAAMAEEMGRTDR